MTAPKGLGGLTGLQGFVIADPYATAAERHGSPADPAHGVPGEATYPLPYEQYPGEPHGPYGAEAQLLGFDILAEGVLPAGFLGEDPTADLQPVTHAAPWPEGLPTATHGEQYEEYRQQLIDIHASNQGGSREMSYLPTADPVNDDWRVMEDVNRGDTKQEAIPDQLKSSGSGGWGSTDRVQSYARQNDYGFDAAHMHRRFADANGIPGNFMWMQPGSRPLVKSIPGTARIPVGEGPFAGQSGALGYDSNGAILQELPKAYEPPPDPALADSYPDDYNSPVVELY